MGGISAHMNVTSSTSSELEMDADSMSFQIGMSFENFMSLWVYTIF